MNLSGFPVYNGLAPKGGPKALRVDLDFSAVTTKEIDLVDEQDSDMINFIQSVWIDNSQSPRRLDIVFGGVPMPLRIGAGVMGMFPVIIPGHFRATFTVSAVFPAVLVPVILLNVPQPYFSMVPGVV